MNAPEIASVIKARFGDSVAVHAVRPGFYQVALPAVLADRDAVFVFVRPLEANRVRVSDAGNTCMRLSYTMKIDSEACDALDAVARPQGFRLVDGELVVDVPADEILGAVLGLIQVEAAAEASIVASVKRKVSGDRFRDTVKAELTRLFNGSCRFDHIDEKLDPKGLWPIDALIKMPSADLAVAIVPGALEAERAIGLKLQRDGTMEGRHKWVALPRSMSDLPDKTRDRVLSQYWVPTPSFEEGRAELHGRLRDLGGDA